MKDRTNQSDDDILFKGTQVTRLGHSFQARNPWSSCFGELGQDANHLRENRLFLKSAYCHSLLTHLLLNFLFGQGFPLCFHQSFYEQSFYFTFLPSVFDIAGSEVCIDRNQTGTREREKESNIVPETNIAVCIYLKFHPIFH